mgnify:CR=1 FL=1
MDWEAIVATTIVAVIIVAAILCPIVFIAWGCSSASAHLYNERYGTHYSTLDFFWAGDTIKEFIGQGKNSTVNLNLKEIEQ